ncbi:transaldolase [Aciduliprofundum sp. MAR08-339]|uniref:transaldolase family protein n=1 Tax=Aciduliprofundum sp. (strain MAR08-339) TaxID=673860 RepID=UPI0002A4B0E4|nr:transaldolase [Aciduliprofundum sp. MAR08-339]
MKIFIDTASLKEIKEAISWGIVDGVTTNPSLIRKAVENEARGKSLDSYIVEILKVAGPDRPVSLEVMGLTAEDMIREAEILYDKFNSVAGNVVIKVPINTYSGHYEGLKTIKALSEEGIPVNCTLIMTPEQALLAAKAGAKYVSPFAGRIDDFLRVKKGLKPGVDFQKGDYYPWDGTGVDDNGIRSGSDLVEKVVVILDHYNYDTEVIASSIRNTRQVREVAMIGAHIATIPFKVLESMLLHPKTEEGVKKFSEDAEKAGYEEVFK